MHFLSWVHHYLRNSCSQFPVEFSEFLNFVIFHGKLFKRQFHHNFGSMPGKLRLRKGRNGLIVMHIGAAEFPIALRHGRRLYRVCPVCGAWFETATGWKKHIDTYHPDFFDFMTMLRLRELRSISLMVEAMSKYTGKPCLDRLIMLISDLDDNVDVQYIVYDSGAGHMHVHGLIDFDKFIELLRDFPCKEIGLKIVHIRNNAPYVGRSVVTRYFRFVVKGTNRALLRFTINDGLIDTVLSKALKPMTNQ